MTLTPREYAFADPATSEAMGLPPREHGLLLCEDESGKHVTLVGDADYVRMLRSAPPAELAGLEADSQAFAPSGLSAPLRRDGWPDEW
jgi:hypothetical protein